MKYEVQATVFCKFEYSSYPMDKQQCNISFGSSSSGAIFVLNESNQNRRQVNTHESSDFDVSISFWDLKTGKGNNNVGIRIVMTRITTTFILKYYIPCIAIVLVTIMGFVIPVSSIPGRVALLVTQFLTLINLFIYQMVN